MGKNLVLCSDGTNNSMEGPLTNIVRIHQLASGVEGQVSVYDAGVGIEAKPGLRTRLARGISKLSGSAFGSGLLRNVEDAYRSLVEHYEDQDRVFMFGFSRGAYTVKVVGGLLKEYGLVRSEHRSRIPEIVKAYAKRQDGEEKGRLKAICRPVRPHFIGLFDAVSSVGWAWNPKTFPWTATMPDVQHVRHALALDERRAKFRPNRVYPQVGQDVREVWFAGVHSDIGGGYRSPMDQLGRVTLRWMLEEAMACGLRLSSPSALGELAKTQERDEQAAQNESLTWAWWGLEVLPLPHWSKSGDKWVEGRRIYRGAGWRDVRAKDFVSESVKRRRLSPKNEAFANVLNDIGWYPAQFGQD